VHRSRLARLGHGGRMDMGMYEYDSRTGGTAASLSYDSAGKGSPSRKRSFGDGVASLTADGDKQYNYDVLGRLTLVESALNSNVKLAAYRYDALGRLAMQVTYDYVQDPNDPNAYYDESNTTRYYYYDTPVAGGDGASSPVLPQVVEIKDGSGDTTDQFVWGPAYVDELLLHERDADGDTGGLEILASVPHPAGLTTNPVGARALRLGYRSKAASLSFRGCVTDQLRYCSKAASLSFRGCVTDQLRYCSKAASLTN